MCYTIHVSKARERYTERKGNNNEEDSNTNTNVNGRFTVNVWM